MRLAYLWLVSLFSLVAGVVPAATGIHTEKVIGGLTQPWGLGLLDNGDFLVTERAGRLLYVSNGKAHPVANLPPVRAKGQGGLLDITIARDFEASREVFLTLARPGPGGASTALVVARLSDDARRLDNLRYLFTARPVSSSGRHFGSRVVEAPDGTLFVTLGERGDRPSSQDLSSHNGSVIRVNRDGTVPADNPFVSHAGALPEIWSYGHRNIQGAALDLNGALIVVEHGARGGDEINRVRRGANYGWPVIAYGRHYSGRKIGEGTHKAGMEQPDYYWDPSIAPSGMIVYSGKLWPQWRGHIFVGSLKFNYISHLAGDPMAEVGQIKDDTTLRVRDIAEGPDGAIWYISVNTGAVYRMTPD